ncbi:MAG TPA: hypothetical protein VGR26_16105 [Acidimicrobiales bacterium]|nr:hypothetical protein [Acidimicrobiales bacterium]
MSFPRMLAGLVAGLLALSGLSVSPSSAQDAQRPVVGAVFGDSFASGEGLAGIDLGEAECQRALGRTAGNGDPSTAWGVTVLEDLPVQRSWFAACTGARTEHFTKTPQRTGLWPYQVKRDKTQYAEAVDGTGTERFDVVLASFGGNDLEFDKVIRDCIGVDDALLGATEGARAGGWAGGAAGGAAGLLTGRCQPGLEQDRREAIDRLTEKNLPDLYNDLAGTTTEGALIVVTGYPQLFEDPTTSWLPANALTRRCHGMHFDDADMIRGLAGRLNQAIGAEVEEAAKRHPERTWVFADVSFPFDGHGLCSDRAESWINGITTGLLEGDFRYKRSFHPTQDGHTKGYAGFIAGFREVEEWRPRPSGASPLGEQILASTPVTVAGVSPFNAGSAFADVVGRFQDPLLPLDAEESGSDFTWDEYGCAITWPTSGQWAPTDGDADHQPLTVMVLDKPAGPMIVRVDVSDPRLRTPSGLGVGSTPDQIIAKLGRDRIAIEELEYSEGIPGSASLLFTSANPTEQHLAMRFLVEDGSVFRVLAGLRDAVLAIEGCI